MTVLTARDVHKAYGPYAVLQGVDLTIQAGERVGLVGDNGCGKSTLGRILAGHEEADSGLARPTGAARVAYLPQVPRLDEQRTARQEVLAGLALWSEAVARHEHISDRLDSGDGELEPLLKAQAAAAADVERLGGWEMSHLAESVLGRLGITDLDARLGTMSGGEQRRVVLARVLVAEPDLAVLDEPTNHLDIATVEWLEQHLVEQFKGALLLITHDRYMLDRVAKRIVELDRGRLRSYEVRELGAYETFIEAKAERMAQQVRVEANRQNFLRQELDWLRRAPKARTGKQKARINRAEEALEKKPAKTKKRMQIKVDEIRTGKSILELQGLDLHVAGMELVRGLDFILTKGQRVGVIGPNGCGKTTLLRAIIGEREPDGGKVVKGKNTRVTYLSQDRDDLDDDRTVMENVADDGMTVHIGDQALDVHSYLARFMFPPEALRQPVGSLSGGERTRVLLAKLLCRTTNLLVLDEPTNDLDVSTLSALEQMLMEFSGTALVVTHDRWFLDRVATRLLVFEGDGRVVHHAGNYSTYLGLRRQEEAARRHHQQAEERPSRKKATRPRPAAEGPRPLTYAERLELAGLEEQIEQADARVAELEARMADPELYASRGADVPALVAELDQARAEAAQLMDRWEELEVRA